MSSKTPAEILGTWIASAAQAQVEFHSLMRDVYEWQKKTFPNATIHSCAVHLEKECREVAVSPDDQSEMADVYMRAAWFCREMEATARTLGYDLHKAVADKFKVNQERTWGEPE